MLSKLLDKNLKVSVNISKQQHSANTAALRSRPGEPLDASSLRQIGFISEQAGYRVIHLTQVCWSSRAPGRCRMAAGAKCLISAMKHWWSVWTSFPVNLQSEHTLQQKYQHTDQQDLSKYLHCGLTSCSTNIFRDLLNGKTLFIWSIY